VGRHFNGAYSVRSGYHGAHKRQPDCPALDAWACSQGHINPTTQLIDERNVGGFAHSKQVRECQRCGEARDKKRVN